MTISSKKVIVRKAIANDLVTRNAASDFFSYLRKLDKKILILDFGGVVFVSRSFADEYITQKQKFKHARLEEINEPEVVSRMFEIVSEVRTSTVETPRLRAHTLSF